MIQHPGSASLFDVYLFITYIYICVCIYIYIYTTHPLYINIHMVSMYISYTNMHTYNIDIYLNIHTYRQTDRQTDRQACSDI